MGGCYEILWQGRKRLIEWYESEENNFIPVADEEQERIKAIFKKDIKERDRKDARVNFRVNSYDLALFKAKARQEGLNYQSLLAQLIHKYARSKWWISLEQYVSSCAIFPE